MENLGCLCKYTVCLHAGLLVALASMPGTAAVLSSAPCSAEASGDSWLGSMLWVAQGPTEVLRQAGLGLELPPSSAFILLCD